MDRLACVDVVALPLQLLLRAHPEWSACPVAVVEDDRPQARVLFVNNLASRLGVRTGQRYATALAIARELRAGTVSPLQIEQGRHAIVERLRAFSPHIEPSSDTPGVFWLDASGLGRLFRSCTAWAAQVRDGLQQAGFRASAAVGFTRFGTYALAIAYRDAVCCRNLADEQTRVERVPLSRLAIDPDVRDRLLALGVNTVGDFLRLPADAIRSRFGAATDALFQIAAGHRWAPLVPVPVTPRYEAAVDFEAPEHHVERLVFIVKRLLDGLVAAVAAQHQAVVGITLHMKLDDRSTRVESVRPAASTLDTAQLLTLIRLRLESTALPCGIVTLTATADTCPALGHQHRLFSETRRDAEAAHQAFARLRAECGENSVVRARICDGHLPVARFAWEPFAELPARTTPRVVAARPLVRRIYPSPPAVSAAALRDRDDGPVESRQGPYVVSGGWWGGAGDGGERASAVHRDYYFVHTRDGELWWIYYDRRRERVFLQGRIE